MPETTEDAFVIIDAVKRELHLVRTNPPLVVSIHESEIDQVVETLGASELRPEKYSGFDKLIWTALVLSKRSKDDQTKTDLLERVAKSKEDGTCVALRY